MLLPAAASLFCVIVAVMTWAAWQLWHVQVRIWLIPRKVIEVAAEALSSAHGERAARVARDLELEAWRRSDPVEAGKWNRVVNQLRRRAVKQTKGHS